MNCVNAKVRGSLIGRCLELRCLLVEKTPTSRISSRLAEQLGLTEFREVFIDDTDRVWKISLFSVVVWCKKFNQEDRVVCVFPLVNCDPKDAAFEMILGQDAFEQFPDIATYRCRNQNPTPGPNFDSLGRINFVLVAKLAPLHKVPRLNRFVEYNCDDSKSVFRMALNKVTRQLVVIWRSSDVVYRYACVSKDVELQIEQGASKGKTMSEVKTNCHCQAIDSFPSDTILLDPTIGEPICEV